MQEGEIDGIMKHARELEEVQKADDSFGTAGWWQLPMKERFTGARLIRLEANQRECMKKRFIFKDKAEYLEEFAHFFTQLMRGDVKNMKEYAEANKLKRVPKKDREGLDSVILD